MTKLKLVSEVPTENQIKLAIIQFLILKGALVLRVNSGAAAGEYQDQQGRTRKRFLRFTQWYAQGLSFEEGQAGVSDVLAILPPWASKVGQLLFVVVECKVPGNTPTVAQRRFMAEVEARGGTAIVATGVDDLMGLFE